MKNTNPQLKITNWSFYHQLVISTFSSLTMMLLVLMMMLLVVMRMLLLVMMMLLVLVKVLWTCSLENTSNSEEDQGSPLGQT